ncbi:MAG: arabinan endo,5-alpha-L-arabinosidase [Thermoleophilia bacterium]|nr:arabinan endo,5-alpha-L-arabinosidase [Thermoleophilia bacterium]
MGCCCNGMGTRPPALPPAQSPVQLGTPADPVVTAPPAPVDPAPSTPPPPAQEQAEQGSGDVATRTYVNPVFGANAPDPTVTRGEDGMFYAYTTETGGLPFQVLRSPDLVSWDRVGAAFEGNGPAWIDRNRWAPDVRRTGDHFTMTYSGRGDDGRMRIGYATSTTARGPFTDRGVLLEGDSSGYFIDPQLVQVGDQWKLYYGSTGGNDRKDQTGITGADVTIAADGSMSVGASSKVVLPEGSSRNLVEGAWMHEKDGQYYLFYSDGRFDAADGPDAYALQVARSSSPDGPFEKLDHPVIASGNGFGGPGHNSIITDDAGQDWVAYHAWGADRSKGRMLLIDKVDWVDGWPVVNGGSGPSHGAMRAPVITARDGASALT